MRQSNPAHLSVDDADAMRGLGRALGRALGAPSPSALVIALQGDLGAGKTTFVSGVMAALGVAGPVRSPTYTLLEPYETATRRVFHLDLYRLADPQEVEPLGLRDLLTADAALLIEWPERGAGYLPVADLRIDIAYPSQGVDGRELNLLAGSPAGEALLNEMLKVQ